MRRSFVVVASLLGTLVVCTEIGAGFYRGDGASPQALAAALRERGDIGESDREDMARQMRARATKNPPGLGIPSLALLDGLMLLSVFVVVLGVFMGAGVQGRVQAVLTLVVCLLVLLGSIVLGFRFFAKVMVMLALLMAPPFGTLAYLAIYGFFARDVAAAILGLLMILKMLIATCLVLASERFLQNKGLVTIFLTSLVANVVVTFLHGLVPAFLVSITDGIAAIANAVLAAAGSLFLLVGSLFGTLRLFRADRSG